MLLRTLAIQGGEAHVGLDEINSSKPVVEALILIGLLSLVVSRTLRELFKDIIEA